MSLSITLDFWTILTTLLLFLLTLLWIRSRRPSDLPPGPRTLPILGNIRTLFQGDLLTLATVLRKIYGDVFSLSIGPYWVIFVNGHEALKEVFVKNGEFFSDRPDVYYARHIKKLKGIAYAYPWQEQRKFTLNLLRGFGFGNRGIESTIKEEAEHFVQSLKKEKGNSVSIVGSIHKAVSNVICSIVLGKRFDYDDKEFEKFIHAITKTVVNKYIPKVNLLPFLYWIPKIRKSCQQCENDNMEIRAWFQRHIDVHKSTLDENNVRDFIDAFLIEIKKIKDHSNTQFTEENLKYLILDLFSAGTETTSTTIQWAALFLATNQDVQDKIRAEIEKIVPSGLPTLSDKQDFHYCQVVIAETQRLGDILPLSIPHTASKDTRVCGYRIPKGAIVIPNLNSVMRDETTFPDPDKFDPERFLDGEGKFCRQDRILPYSLGKRTCLGEALARNELFLFFTAIVYTFKILPPEGEDLSKIRGRLGITHGPMPFKVRFVEFDQKQ